MKSRNPSHQTSIGLEARGKFSLALAASAKCISQGVQNQKTGTKFIIRDTAQQHNEWESTQRNSLLRQRQRCTPGEQGVGVLPNKEERSEEAVKSFLQGSSSRSMFTLANYLVSFPHLTCARTLPNTHAQLFPKMDSSPEAYGMALASHIMGWCPLLFAQ